MNNEDSNTAKSNKKYLNVESQFKNLVGDIKESFPHVDENLILDILRLEHFKPNWQGTATIEIKYKRNSSNLKEKKDRLYEKFDMLPMEKDEKTLRFKARKMYLRDIEEFFENDSDIEYLTGSARPTEDDQYPSSQ